MKQIRLVCRQCAWRGDVSGSIKEILSEEPVKERKVHPDTAEVTFEITERVKKVWSVLKGKVDEEEEVRYKCPVCKAPLKEAD